nr:beta-glucosidase 44-like [Tanacetum cinerariifolium]
MTFNEPRVVADLGYNTGLFAPGRCSKAYENCTTGDSAIEPYIVAHNLILSHAAAVQRYHQKYQEKQKGRIGILLDFAWYEPLTRSKADNLAAQRARDFHVGWFLHPIVYGEYPKTMQNFVKDRLPKFTIEEMSAKAYQLVNGHILIGFTTYHEAFTKPLCLHDTTRINYYKSYLAALKQSVDEGANVIGYFAWSLPDNFEWRLGFTSRFGIVYVDFKTLKRYPKMCAYWFKKILRKNKRIKVFAHLVVPSHHQAESTISPVILTKRFRKFNLDLWLLMIFDYVSISSLYDLSNDLFSLFLDDTMIYWCDEYKSEDEDQKTAQMKKK